MVGGHVYEEDPYPGGIGCAWTYVTKGPDQADAFNGLCTTCSRCTEVCPVGIDIPWLNTVIRQRHASCAGAGLRQHLFARADLMGRALSPLAPLVNADRRTPVARLSFRLLGLDPERTLPAYARPTFREWWRGRAEAASASAAAGASRSAGATKNGEKVALFVDCRTNHNRPSVGVAAVRVLEEAGVEALVDEGYEILCFEPSCLSALRDDYRRLLELTPAADDRRLAQLERRSHDITEYLIGLSGANASRFRRSRCEGPTSSTATAIRKAWVSATPRQSSCGSFPA